MSLFEVSVAGDGRAWVAVTGFSALSENGSWRLGVPTATELMSDFVQVGPSDRTRDLIRSALSSLRREIPEVIEVATPLHEQRKRTVEHQAESSPDTQRAKSSFETASHRVSTR